MVSAMVIRPTLIAVRALQWMSAVIVLGITAHFIAKFPRGEHVLYQIVISALSVALFLPAFVSPFMPTTLSKAVLAIDVVFSYLWLTAFIFAAQDYNLHHRCLFNAPPGASCSIKKANESFMFLAFIFTLSGVFLEISNLWAFRRENEVPIHDKPTTERAPMDAPADAPTANV